MSLEPTLCPSPTILSFRLCPWWFFFGTMTHGEELKKRSVRGAFSRRIVGVATIVAPGDGHSSARTGKDLPDWSGSGDGAAKSPRHGLSKFRLTQKTAPAVRIPFSPPLTPAKAFSRSGRGRIFPLFSRVMRAGLSTGLGAKRPEGGLSGPTFSGPHDCTDLVRSL